MKPFPSSPAQYQRQPENRFRTFQAAFGLDNSDNAPCLHVAVFQAALICINCKTDKAQLHRQASVPPFPRPPIPEPNKTRYHLIIRRYREPPMSKPQTPSPWRIIQPVRAQIRRAILFSAAAIVLGIAALLLMAHILQGLLNNRADWFSAALFAALTLTAFFLRGYAFRVSHLAAFRLETILRGELADRLARVSLGYLHDRGAAALTKVMQDDVHGLHAFVADSTPLYARAYAAPLISFAVLLFVDWRLAMVAAAVLAAGMVMFSLTMRNAGESTAAYNAVREHVNTAVVEFVQAMPMVRTFDGGETSFGRYQHALDNYLAMLIGWYRSVGGSARTGMLMLNPAPTLIALLWAGFYWFCADALPFGTWLAVLLLGTGMAEALTPYISLYHLIEQGKISAERIIEVLDAPVLPVLAPPQTPQDAGVCFEHVSFRYPGRSENALTDISFTVPAGSFTALVGGSGAGKTTAARLIPRFLGRRQRQHPHRRRRHPPPRPRNPDGASRLRLPRQLPVQRQHRRQHPPRHA